MAMVDVKRCIRVLAALVTMLEGREASSSKELHSIHDDQAVPATRRVWRCMPQSHRLGAGRVPPGIASRESQPRSSRPNSSGRARPPLDADGAGGVGRVCQPIDERDFERPVRCESQARPFERSRLVPPRTGACPEPESAAALNFASRPLQSQASPAVAGSDDWRYWRCR